MIDVGLGRFVVIEPRRFSSGLTVRQYPYHPESTLSFILVIFNMSYALETKKRKFDRILESLTDGAAFQSRTSLNSRNNGSTISLVNDSLPDASKRPRTSSKSLLNAPKIATTTTTSLTGHYLPSSRQAFLERLETFRQVTMWHIPSTESINASAWVKRGWYCVDTDTVFCGSCKERLWVDLEVRARDTQAAEAELSAKDRDDTEDYFDITELYDALIKRYEQMITTAHSESCPWRRRGCDASIQRIEGLLNTNNAISALQSRYESLSTQVTEVPHIFSPSEMEAREIDLDELRFEGDAELMEDLVRLSACGWQSKSDDVIECRHCFRSLGLWLYRGMAPAMDKLDPLESHLEYCPWRSADAQDTEVAVPVLEGTETVQKKEKAHGIMLVYYAIAKYNAKKRRPIVDSKGVLKTDDSRPTTSESLTPEQREKKRTDLLRRIKDLKKPFRIKSLFRKEKV